MTVLMIHNNTKRLVKLIPKNGMDFLSISGSRLDLLFQLLLVLFQLLDFPVNFIRICDTFLRRLSLAVSAYLRCFAIFAFPETVILSIGMASFRGVKKDFPVAVLVLSYPVQSHRLLPRFFTDDVFIPWFGQLTNAFFLSSFPIAALGLLCSHFKLLCRRSPPQTAFFLFLRLQKVAF